jgi:hypothetical protein
VLTRAGGPWWPGSLSRGPRRFPKIPSPESYVRILKAFDAAHQLRARPSSQDEYHRVLSVRVRDSVGRHC